MKYGKFLRLDRREKNGKISLAAVVECDRFYFREGETALDLNGVWHPNRIYATPDCDRFLFLRQYKYNKDNRTMQISIAEACGVAKKELRAIDKKRELRTTQKEGIPAANLPIYDHKKYLINMMRTNNPGINIVNNLPACLESMGGVTRLYIVGSRSHSRELLYEMDTTRRYSGNNSYSPNWGELAVELTFPQLRKLRFVHGVATLSDAPLDSLYNDMRVRRCQWLEVVPNRRGGKKAHVEIKNGYICHGVHASTAEEARKDGSWFVRQEKDYRREEKARKAAARREIDEVKAKITRLARAGRGMTIRLEDSLAAGNCRPGSRNWCARHHIDPDGELTINKFCSILREDAKRKESIKLALLAGWAAVRRVEKEAL